MGAASYNRGSAFIARQISGEIKRSPVAAEAFARDHAARRILLRLEARLSKALGRWRLLRSEKALERRRAAAVLEAVEQTYNEARAAGLEAGPALYWIALARDRARRADPC